MLHIKRSPRGLLGLGMCVLCGLDMGKDDDDVDDLLFTWRSERIHLFKVPHGAAIELRSHFCSGKYRNYTVNMLMK